MDLTPDIIRSLIEEEINNSFLQEQEGPQSAEDAAALIMSTLLGYSAGPAGLAPDEVLAQTKRLLNQHRASKEAANRKDLEETYSEKQRRWACAQMGKSRKNFKGEPKLSKAEAKEMCKADVEKK